MTSREDTTLYLDRSMVREILIGHNAATQAVLSKIDALPIFTAEDFLVHAHRVLDEEVYRGLQEAMVLIGAKNDNVSEAVKASNIGAAWHILDRIISDGGAPVYCAHCDHEHPLHEDARGFHHVIRGERVPCGSVSSTVRGEDS